MSTFTTIIWHSCGCHSYSNQRRKINKRNPDKKRRSKVSLFADDMILYMLLLSHFSHVRLCATHTESTVWQPTRLPHPWDSPGKNTGVGCHFLLQCMKVKSESEVAQSCPTPSDPMDCSPLGASIHGIFPGKSTGVGCHCLLRYCT